MPFIFISYSHRDRPFMTQFVQRLRRVYGHDAIWYDKDLHGGDLYAQEIRRNISDSEIFVILMSPEAMQSAYCRKEWQQALGENKAILPVLVQDNTDIVSELEPYQYVDMSAGITGESMDRFHAAVHRLRTAYPEKIKYVPSAPPRRAVRALPLLPLMLMFFLVLGGVLLAQFGIGMPEPTAATTPQQTPIVGIITPSAPPQAPTATLPILPTRSTGGEGQSLNVIRSQGGVAFCNVNPATFPLANLSVAFAIGTGETYALAEEFPGVASIAPGTCLCIRNRDIDSTLPQQCSDANSSATKRSAGDWFNAEMTVTFEGQMCMLASGVHEKRCF